MISKSLIQTKDELVTVQEDISLAEALDILEDSGFRCVPILDKTCKIFRGNIYKMHIYRHKSRGGDMTLLVTYLPFSSFTHFINSRTAFEPMSIAA